jgi:hypothetical protein
MDYAVAVAGWHRIFREFSAKTAGQPAEAILFRAVI